MGIQPPSLYKYFPSKLAVYDALFQRGAADTLAVFRAAADRAEPGFEPSAEAFAPSLDFVGEVRSQLERAAACGHVHPDAASDEGMALLSVLVSGIVSQRLANQPDASWDDGVYTRLAARALEMFRLSFPANVGT
jgi:AcrR family transcriptional regulator